MRASTFVLCITGLGSLLLAEDKIEGPAKPQSKAKLQPIAREGVTESLHPLYSLLMDEKQKEGKPVKLTIKELRRDEKTSVVEYTYVSGSSVGSSMTVAFALYRMALDRNAKFFVTLQTKDKESSSEYLVGFSDKKESDPAKYFGVKGPLNDKMHWWSVEDLGKTLFRDDKK